jgi:hypothetical protein
MPGAGSARMEDAVSVTQVARTIADYLGFPLENVAPALPVLHELRRR